MQPTPWHSPGVCFNQAAAAGQAAYTLGCLPAQHSALGTQQALSTHVEAVRMTGRSRMGANSTCVMSPQWPSSTASHLPVTQLHTRTVSSALPEASVEVP